MIHLHYFYRISENNLRWPVGKVGCLYSPNCREHLFSESGLPTTFHSRKPRWCLSMKKGPGCRNPGPFFMLKHQRGLREWKVVGSPLSEKTLLLGLS